MDSKNCGVYTVKKETGSNLHRNILSFNFYLMSGHKGEKICRLK